LRKSVCSDGHDVSVRPPHRVGFDEQRQGVANRRDGLARVDEPLNELHRLAIHAEPIGVHDAAGQKERVEVVDDRLLERQVNAELVTPLVMLPRLDGSGLRRDQRRSRACFVERLARFRELYLFYTVRRQDRDTLAMEPASGHVSSGEVGEICRKRWADSVAMSSARQLHTVAFRHARSAGRG
jgi:hypothetical protein